MGFYFIRTTGWKSAEIKGDSHKFVKAYKTALLSELKDSAIHNIANSGNKICFKAPVFRFVWNGFNRFNPISKGCFELQVIDNYLIIKYELFFVEFFVLSVIFSLIPAMGIFPSLFWRISAFVLIWVIYLIHVFLGTHRTDNYLRRLFDELNNKPKKVADQKSLGRN